MAPFWRTIIEKKKFYQLWVPWYTHDLFPVAFLMWWLASLVVCTTIRHWTQVTLFRIFNSVSRLPSLQIHYRNRPGNKIKRSCKRHRSSEKDLNCECLSISCFEFRCYPDSNEARSFNWCCYLCIQRFTISVAAHSLLSQVLFPL